LYTLAVDPMLGHRVTCAAVVTLVDAVAGADTLRAHKEAASQVAVADRIVITKTDLAPSDAVAGLLDGLNGWAERIHGADVASPAALLFAAAPAVAARRRLTAQAVPPPTTHKAIATLSVVFATAPARFAFARALGGLASDRGADLLRVKGLIEFADRPGKVAAIHAVQHTIYRPDWLDRWPDADTRSRLVFITRNMDDAEIFDRFAAFAPVPWTVAALDTAA
jgi:G3E family GTPase